MWELNLEGGAGWKEYLLGLTSSCNGRMPIKLVYGEAKSGGEGSSQPQYLKGFGMGWGMI